MSDYNLYDPEGTSIEDLMARLYKLQGRIASTVSDVQRVENGIEEYQSSITQEVNRINLNVLELTSGLDGNTSKIGDLEVRADGITANVSEISENLTESLSKIGNLEVRADGIDASVGELYTSILGQGEKISTIELDVDGILSTVSDFQTDFVDIYSSISTIDQKADSIISTVSSLDTRIGAAQSSITQLSGQISSKVELSDFNGNTIWSMIDQTATNVKIKAENIQLDGITTVASSLSIGSSFQDNTYKSINFRGSLGGASIYSERADQLTTYALNSVILETASGAGDITLRTKTLNLTNVDSVEWGSNIPSARFG